MWILVVDDEPLIALDLEETFREAGAQVIKTSTLHSAREAAENSDISAAVLDFRLGNETAESVAEILAGRGIPFIFYSGQSPPDHLRNKFRRARYLVKPVQQRVFVKTFLDMMRDASL